MCNEGRQSAVSAACLFHRLDSGSLASLCLALLTPLVTRWRCRTNAASGGTLTLSKAVRMRFCNLLSSFIFEIMMIFFYVHAGIRVSALNI